MFTLNLVSATLALFGILPLWFPSSQTPQTSPFWLRRVSKPNAHNNTVIVEYEGTVKPKVFLEKRGVDEEFVYLFSSDREIEHELGTVVISPKRDLLFALHFLFSDVLYTFQFKQERPDTFEQNFGPIRADVPNVLTYQPGSGDVDFRATYNVTRVEGDWVGLNWDVFVTSEYDDGSQNTIQHFLKWYTEETRGSGPIPPLSLKGSSESTIQKRSTAKITKWPKGHGTVMMVRPRSSAMSIEGQEFDLESSRSPHGHAVKRGKREDLVSLTKFNEVQGQVMEGRQRRSYLKRRSISNPTSSTPNYYQHYDFTLKPDTKDREGLIILGYDWVLRSNPEPPVYQISIHNFLPFHLDTHQRAYPPGFVAFTKQYDGYGGSGFERQECKRGETYCSLTCTAFGDGIREVQIARVGSGITTTALKTCRESQENFYIICPYIIFGQSSSDAGEYRCTARTNSSEVSKIYTLTVTN